MVSFSNTPPFGNRNASFVGTQYLGVRDIGRLAQCCTVFRDWSLNKECAVIWKNASLLDKIPIVDGEDRDYKEDLKIIRKILSSVHGLVGNIIGPVPPLSEKKFREFTVEHPDAFGAGYFRDNFVLLVNPSYIERRVDENTPLALQDGKLVEVDKSQVQAQTLVVAATLPNLLMLLKYPLKGKEHGPVYRIEKELLDAVIEQCTYFPKEAEVICMRKHIIEESRNKQPVSQQDLVEAKAPGGGYMVMSVLERLLFTAERILTTGECPDVKKPQWTVMRGVEVVEVWDDLHHLVMGGHVRGAGVDISYDYFDDYHAHIGVVPGCLAEVANKK